MDSCISNPPYNVRWIIPPFADIQKRFNESGVPPKSNANYAFVLTALEKTTGKSAFILPSGTISSSEKNELRIRKHLVNKNLIDAVVLCPDGMFESTSIPVCVLLFDRKKRDKNVVFIDARKTYDEVVRDQNGQYGGSSKTKRTYHKTIKSFNDKTIEKIVKSIKSRNCEEGFSACVSVNEISENGYDLKPARWIKHIAESESHRPYEEIIADLNRVRIERNRCKLVINETTAKEVGFDIRVYKSEKDDALDINSKIKSISDKRIVESDYIQFSKNKNEIIFKNNSKESISFLMPIMLQSWKQHIIFMNLEENRYLIELRDSLLPDLMNGKVKTYDDKTTETHA